MISNMPKKEADRINEDDKEHRIGNPMGCKVIYCIGIFKNGHQDTDEGIKKNNGQSENKGL